MRILLVRLSAIGDVVHTLPALERLRQALPAAELHWVAEPPAVELLEGHPALDRVWRFDRPGFGRAQGWSRTLGSLGQSVAGLARTRFELALDLQGLARSACLARWASPRVLGPAWAREGARYLYRHPVDCPRPGQAHAVVRAGVLVDALLSALGAPVPDGPLPHPRLALAIEPRSHDGLSVVLLPGAGKPTNRPPVPLLAEVGSRLAEELGARITLVGGRGDRTLGQEVQARARRRFDDRTGQRSLRETARLLAEADLVIGGDTGPLHLARALGRPVLGLFAAADPARTGPAGLPGAAQVRVLRGAAPCAPCLKKRCRRLGRRVCFDPLQASAVAHAAILMLATNVS